MTHKLLTIIALITLTATAQAQPLTLPVGEFSTAQPGAAYPPPWQPLIFKKIENTTTYTLVEDNGIVVLRADSDDAASGLTREVAIDPAQYPIIEWRWKIANVLQRGDAASKAGDDYPARVYITFAYDPAQVGLLEKAKYQAARLFYGKYPPSAAINYIWASKTPSGTRIANPYTKRVQMFALQSGAQKANQWQTETRNIHHDYQTAFGKPPPMISGIAVMTDTDNTHESATAWFGDIVFRAAE